MQSKAKVGYTQSQLVLPLLGSLIEAGGKLPAKDACAAVAKAVGVTPERRAERIPGLASSHFDRDVRWARQKLIVTGLLSSPQYGLWEITGAGRNSLRQARPGVVITIYETAAGKAVWASCQDAFAELDDGSVSAIVTSPPYPLLRQKQYGNLPEAEYVDWLADLAYSWKRILKDDGSLILNLGDCWERGRPTQSLYVERLLLKLCDELGYRLAQRFEWHHPAKLPAPAEWCTVRRVRVKSSLERVLWLSKSDHPYADNRGVLTPYSESMVRRIQNGGETGARRPSGHVLKPNAFGVDHGGAIPSNLIVASNTASNGDYQAACRATGLPIHPARFPEAIPDFMIRLTTKPGDLVADPFGGSFVTAAVAERLGRRFITSEKVLEYALGGGLRLGGELPAALAS
jgi:site-specific DNA-methyltransferase (cytosine-N4-specific)